MRDRTKARRHRMSMGAIVSATMVSVQLKGQGLLGHVEETFVASLKEGDSFVLQVTPWRWCRSKVWWRKCVGPSRPQPERLHGWEEDELEFRIVSPFALGLGSDGWGRARLGA